MQTGSGSDLWVMLVAVGVCVLPAVVLFWIAVFSRRVVVEEELVARGQCPQCWYVLTASERGPQRDAPNRIPDRCPECGLRDPLGKSGEARRSYSVSDSVRS